MSDKGVNNDKKQKLREKYHKGGGKEKQGNIIWIIGMLLKKKPEQGTKI